MWFNAANWAPSPSLLLRANLLYCAAICGGGHARSGLKAPHSHGRPKPNKRDDQRKAASVTGRRRVHRAWPDESDPE